MHDSRDKANRGVSLDGTKCGASPDGEINGVFPDQKNCGADPRFQTKERLIRWNKYLLAKQRW